MDYFNIVGFDSATLYFYFSGEAGSFELYHCLGDGTTDKHSSYEHVNRPAFWEDRVSRYLRVSSMDISFNI